MKTCLDDLPVRLHDYVRTGQATHHPDRLHASARPPPWVPTSATQPTARRRRWELPAVLGTSSPGLLCPINGQLGLRSVHSCTPSCVMG